MAPALVAWLWGLGLGLLVGLATLLGNVATRSGALTLAILTGLVAGLGGWEWGVVLVAFDACLFVTVRYRRVVKASIETVGREPRLGWAGALARLGWAAILATLYGRSDSALGYAAFVGAVAASAADLAATQLGVLSAQRPRLVTTWRPALPGTPGAISTLGTIAAVGASWLIGLVALSAQALSSWLAQSPAAPLWAWLPVAALAGGMAGTVLDSLLAATGQRVYYDPRREQPSECDVDSTGAPNEPVRGWAWLTSEAIDLVSTAVGAAATCAVATWLAHSLGHW
ncbi:MAG: DUF92 domain-containing protein [Anaerolineales bacterium]